MPVTSALPPRTFERLKAVFGDCVPKQNAAALLDASPAAPQSPEELQALRALVVELQGKKLSEIPVQAKGTIGEATASSTQSRAMPAATSLQLRQVQAARELRTPDGLLKVVSEKKAQALFDEIAAMKDIPHGFLEDGCLHRSHVIGKRLEDKGVLAEKIFTIPLGGDLVMDTPKARLGFTVVWYHEAITVHVQTKDGVERRVLDPSVGDKPLTVEEWTKGMKGSDGAPLETFFLPRFAYGLGARDNPPSAYVQKDLDEALAFCRDGWRESMKGYEEMGFYEGEAHKLAGRPYP
jgi:hypothetical protein